MFEDLINNNQEEKKPAPQPKISVTQPASQPAEPVSKPEAQPVQSPDAASFVQPSQPSASQGADVFSLENICLSFPTATGVFKLFDNFNLRIEDLPGQGQFFSILGASGSGKSQILKLLSGLSKPNSGTIKFYGKEIGNDHYIPMVFQQYSSFPWMTVLENVALPLVMQGVDKETANSRAMELLNVVGLQDQAEKWAQYPTLSGGQLQRVSLARNLVCKSQILLLDEATGALDIFAKRDMQKALLDVYYNSKLDPTIINVTHDISEAVFLSNRIYILRANPCSVYRIVDVDFGPGKRTDEIRKTAKFADYVSMVEKLMDEVNKLNIQNPKA